MNDILILYRVYTKNLMDNISWFINAFILPIILIFIFSIIGKNSFGGLITSYDYYTFSILTYACFSTSLIVSTCLVSNAEKEIIKRVVKAGISVEKILVSKIFSTVSYTVFFHWIILLFMALLFRVKIGSSFCEIILVFMQLLFFEFFSACIGALCSSFFKDEYIINQLLSFLAIFFSLLGGMFFKVSSVGKVLFYVSMLSPMRWILKSIFSVIYDDNLSCALLFDFELIVIGVICFLISVKLLKKEVFQ